MNWLRRLVANWRTTRPGQFRRVIVLLFDGLEPAAVDRYLDEGPLHYLALVSDVGTRDEWAEFEPLEPAEFAATLTGRGLRTVVLPALSEPPPDGLAGICAADRRQQERLLAALSRGRSEVIVAVFDMAAQLARLYGPHPDADQQRIIRDVYARMDEIVGKAFSFVDDRTALLAVVPPPLSPRDAGPPPPGFLFATCSPEAVAPPGTRLAPLVRALLGADDQGA
jgi:hypothetical protein